MLKIIKQDKKPDCFGANSKRDWDFICDIEKLKEVRKQW